MKEKGFDLWKRPQGGWLGRRDLVRGGAGLILGASLLRAKPTYADDEDEQDEDHDGRRAERGQANPIPGGVTPFIPFGVFVHHNPLNPDLPLDQLNDPSQITDFEGFVALNRIRGGGTGIKPDGSTMDLAFQADMGFSKGRFIGTDGRHHRGTFAFV